MKLFDLLKSLNNDNAIDPDAPTKSPDDNHLLLDELHSLLNLLGASTPAPQAAMHKSGAPMPTLNLATIFDETIEPEQPPSTAITATPSHRPEVRELLDEFLPMLTQALGERLDQLDDVTLQQWRHVIAQRAGEP